MNDWYEISYMDNNISKKETCENLSQVFLFLKEHVFSEKERIIIELYVDNSLFYAWDV